MVILKTKDELQLMRKAGAITAAALHAGGAAVKPGITTREVDRVIHDYIVGCGAKPSFLGYGGFPASACISVNDEVIHGIPGGRVICEGDIVSIDVGAKIGGYHGDSAYTFACGKISPQAQALLDGTRRALENGIAQAVVGNRIGDISAAVQNTVEPLGYSVVREYVGHGVGKDLHEAPEVPNYGRAGHGVRLAAGMVIAIEPMINAGAWAIRVLDNDWTVVTRDHSLSAHFEHTVAITPDGPVILTRL
ncbi:MAG: type I methionyl aminopeptidase [Candidatus Fimivivens sp.]|nr:type I methionyl aminopeptidase [Candidatus Fimivivens sp.]